jgi:hypothetical protein
MTGPRLEVKRSVTCAHCVVTRAAARSEHRYARPLTLGFCSTQPPLVAMNGPELYGIVTHFLRDAAESSPGDGAVRVRIVSGAHPEVQILAAAGPARATRVRALAIPRHADGTLMGGFTECSGDDTRVEGA